MRRGPCFTYILCSDNRRAIYVGVTRDLSARLDQHRAGRGSDYTRKYKVGTLVYFERHDTAPDAIAREKQIKGWKREKKVALIEAANPEWEGLAAQIHLLR